MEGKEMLEGAAGILKAQLAEADQKIRFLEQQLGMTNQQFTRWMAHLVCEHGEETEAGVWKLEITEANAPDFGEEEVAFQVEPNEEEKKLAFCILSSKSEKYAEMRKSHMEEQQRRQSQAIAQPQPKLVVEK